MEKDYFKNAIQQSMGFPQIIILKRTRKLRYVFQRHKNYQKWIIKQVAKQVKHQNILSNIGEGPTECNKLPSNSKSYTLLLPYFGYKGDLLIRSLRKNMHWTLPENVPTRICYTGTKIGTKVKNINGLVKKSGAEPDCIDYYTDETGRRLNERVIDHNERDKMSHLYKHLQESNIPVFHWETLRSLLAIFKIKSFKEKLLNHCWLEKHNHHLTGKRYQSHSNFLHNSIWQFFAQSWC